MTYQPKRPVRGYVYCIRNPAWPGFVKIGSTTRPENRLRQYQTGTPHRDFELVFSVEFEDRLAAEQELKRILRGLRDGRSEWVAMHPEDVRNLLKGIEKRHGSYQGLRPAHGRGYEGAG